MLSQKRQTSCIGRYIYHIFTAATLIAIYDHDHTYVITYALTIFYLARQKNKAIKIKLNNLHIQYLFLVHGDFLLRPVWAIAAIWRFRSIYAYNTGSWKANKQAASKTKLFFSFATLYISQMSNPWIAALTDLRPRSGPLRQHGVMYACTILHYCIDYAVQRLFCLSYCCERANKSIEFIYELYIHIRIDRWYVCLERLFWFVEIRNEQNCLLPFFTYLLYR